MKARRFPITLMFTIALNANHLSSNIVSGMDGREVGVDGIASLRNIQARFVKKLLELKSSERKSQLLNL